MEGITRTREKTGAPPFSHGEPRGKETLLGLLKERKLEKQDCEQTQQRTKAMRVHTHQARAQAGAVFLVLKLKQVPPG